MSPWPGEPKSQQTELNPINVRLPQFDLTTDEGRQSAHRYLASGIVDLNQAIAALNQRAVSTTNTTTIIQSGGSGGGGGTAPIGIVNDQRGVTSYTTQQSDYGAKIIVGDSSAIAITLDAGVTTPWFAIIDNDSSSIASLTPSGATLVGEDTLPPGCFGIIYFDGVHFFCGATRIATDSSFGYVHPDNVSIGISGGIIRTIGIDSTIATAPLTGTGSRGSMTFVGGLLVSSVQAT